MAGGTRLNIFRRLLSTMPRGHFVDLACGHGKFAIVAKELGWRVTAVDARSKRMPMTPGIDWIQSDVRDFDVSGYDVIGNLGLLYHMDLDSQIDLLKRCAGTKMILDTHVSLEPDSQERGYAGHYFDELAGRTEEQHRASGTASWENLSAFWADENSLHRLLRDCGYTDVWTLEPWYEENRTFFLCL